MSDVTGVRSIIVDDEDHIRVLIRTLLQSLSFSIVGEAVNGIEAVELVEERRPDLILMDINMPQLNGIESLVKIREVDPNVCVIMLTSVADAGSVKQCIDGGASSFIRKDMPVTEMKQLILETWQAHAVGTNDGG